MAFKAGYETSVNCEPFYQCLPREGIKKEIENFVNFIQELLFYVKETLIIGMMNQLPVNKLRGKMLTDFQRAMVLDLKKFYDLRNILHLIKRFHQNKKIRWKESIKRLLITYILNSDGDFLFQ